MVTTLFMEENFLPFEMVQQVLRHSDPKYIRNMRFHSKELIQGNKQQTRTSNINILLMVDAACTIINKIIRVQEHQTQKIGENQYSKKRKEGTNPPQQIVTTGNQPLFSTMGYLHAFLTRKLFLIDISLPNQTNPAIDFGENNLSISDILLQNQLMVNQSPW